MPKSGAIDRPSGPNALLASQPQSSLASTALPPITLKVTTSLAISAAEQALFNSLFGHLIEKILADTEL
jgi:hypothetical protein